MSDTESLTELEVAVLQRLAQSRVTVSAVALAADMDDGWTDAADPYTLLEWLLADLNARGLLIYRIAPEMHINDDQTISWVEDGRKKKHGVPIHIRLTDRAYEAIGYTVIHPEVGRRRRGEFVLHPGDRTNFRTHTMRAEAFPCERCSIEKHLAEFPEHRFNRGGF